MKTRYIKRFRAKFRRIQEDGNAQSHTKQEIGLESCRTTVRKWPPACIMPFVMQVANSSNLIGVDRRFYAGEIEQALGVYGNERTVE